MAVTVWTAAEAATRLHDPSGHEELLGVPLLVLDLRDDDGEPVGLTRVGCPVVGWTSGATRWDVDVELAAGSPDIELLGGDLDAATGALLAGCGPAADVLAQVLRTTAALDVSAALAVESLAYSLLLTGPGFRGWLDDRLLPRKHDQDGPAVLVRRDGPLLELVLNRPQVRNAYDPEVRDGLVEALGLALLDPSTRVVLRGGGPAFCSGGDLRGFGTAGDLVAAHAIRTARHPGPLLHALGERAEVRVHGACVGAGVELAAFAGRLVARPDAFFRLPELAMGTIPGAGGTVSLPRRIGRRRTLLLALSGVDLVASDALRWGLVDAVVEDLMESDVPA